MAFATARPLGNLRPFIFGNHALKLHQQLVFGRGPRGRLQEDQFHAAAAQLFGQQHLIGILATEAIRRVDENRFEVTCGGQIAQSFQPGPQQRGAAVAFILEAPLGWNQVSVALGILRQGCQLAGDRVVLFLPVRGHTGVNRGRFRHSESPGGFREVGPDLGARSCRARGIHKPAPVSPPTIDQIDIPAAAFVADPTDGQPRPPPRCSTACSARLTISLRVNPVEAA